MNVNEIISRIRRGEDSVTQFKRQSIGVAKLADEMVAFANAEGGVKRENTSKDADSKESDRNQPKSGPKAAQKQSKNFQQAHDRFMKPFARSRV